jgi:hypothetical protein
VNFFRGRWRFLQRPPLPSSPSSAANGLAMALLIMRRGAGASFVRGRPGRGGSSGLGLVLFDGQPLAGETAAGGWPREGPAPSFGCPVPSGSLESSNQPIRCRRARGLRQIRGPAKRLISAGWAARRAAWTGALRGGRVPSCCEPATPCCMTLECHATALALAAPARDSCPDRRREEALGA